MARQVETDIERRDTAIRRAHQLGASLRTLAEATGLSHMTIRRITQQ